jgi:hypothetical protein
MNRSRTFYAQHPADQTSGNFCPRFTYGPYLSNLQSDGRGGGCVNNYGASLSPERERDLPARRERLGYHQPALEASQRGYVVCAAPLSFPPSADQTQVSALKGSFVIDFVASLLVGA